MEVSFLSNLWRPLLTLVLSALVVMGSPGPATMSVTAVGAAFGLRRSVPYVGGVILGTSAVLVAVALGVVSLLISLPQLAPVLLAISIAYVLYLAFRIATTPPLSARSPDAVAAPSLAGGFLLGVANPKAYVAIGAVFVGATLPLEPRMFEAAIKTAVLALLIVVIHVAWLLAGASLSRLLRNPVSSSVANLFFAAILIAAAVVALAG